VNPKNATALEITAGGRLYQVVVDEAITGKVSERSGGGGVEEDEKYIRATTKLNIILDFLARSPPP